MQCGMKKTVCLMLALCCIFAAGACTPQKRQVSQRGAERIKDVTVTSLDAQFVIGVTTKADVEKAFGTPTSVRKNVTVNQQNNCDEWQYVYSDSTESGDLKAGINSAVAIGFIPIIGGVAGAAVAQNAGEKQQVTFVSKSLFVSFDKAGKVLTYWISTDNARAGGF